MAELMRSAKMKPHCILFALLLVLLVPGCSREPRYTEQEVREFVVPGTPLAAIIKRFGEPSSDEKNPRFQDGSTDIDEIVYFDLPLSPPGVRENFVFSGFQVRLKKGKAVVWFATHRSNGG